MQAYGSISDKLLALIQFHALKTQLEKVKRDDETFINLSNELKRGKNKLYFIKKTNKPKSNNNPKNPMNAS